MTALDQLLDKARGPAGQPRPVSLDADAGPLAELADMLSRLNGFSAFNSGVQVYRAADPGVGPELATWNTPDTWKNTYNGLAESLFCFGQDLFGVQFAIEARQRVVTFDPETAERHHLGDSLDDWATWLLDNPDTAGCRRFATAWQDTHGALDHHQRLIPWRLFTLGGDYDFANLTAKDSAECLRIRGPLAQKLHNLPDGETLTLTPGTPPPPAHTGQPLIRAELEVFADDNTFLIQDDTVRVNTGPAWIDALIHDLVATAPGAIGIGTARPTTVPVTIEVHDHEPTDETFDAYDHVTEGGLHTTTGRLLISMLDYRPELPRIHIPPGDYAARIYHTGLNTLSRDALHGNDTYRIGLWPDTPRPAHVLKRYDGPRPGG